MEVDKTPSFDGSDLLNTSSKTHKKKKKKDKDIGEKQAAATFKIEPSDKPVEVRTRLVVFNYF